MYAEDVSRFVEVAEHIKSELEVVQVRQLFSAQTLTEMVLSSRKRSMGDNSPLAVNLRVMREESRIVTGIHDIYGSL